MRLKQTFKFKFLVQNTNALCGTSKEKKCLIFTMSKIEV